jgi:transcriptional regulator with XRE-family HTH domain
MVNINKIKQLAKEKGLKLSFLCEKIGASRYRLYDWERGKSFPTENEIQTIADLLGTTVDYLTDKTDKKEKPLVNGDEELTEYLEELKTRPEMRMMFQLAKGATKEDVEKAVKIVEAFLKK